MVEWKPHGHASHKKKKTSTFICSFFVRNIDSMPYASMTAKPRLRSEQNWSDFFDGVFTLVGTC